MEARFAGPARAATLATLIALVAGFVVGPLVGPSPAQAIGPLPACRYDDLLTTPRLYGDARTTLVDTILRVPRLYAPPDLVDVSQAGIAGSGKIRAIVIDDLRAMADAAAAADAAIGVQSAYRSYARQEAVFKGWVDVHGHARALQLSARPGHSEHQLGMAIDFRSEPGGSPFTGDWQKTKAGRWMKAHAWEYGFVMSYPRGKLHVTCYDFEPWHFRYVGRDLAATIQASGLTLREYLWANYTTTIVPAVTPRPARTGSPAAPTGPPASSPTFSPSIQPSPSPSVPVPTASPTPTTAQSTPAPTPEPTAPPDPSPIVSVEAGVAASLAVALAAVLLAAWMVLRRGRARVGL